MFYSTKTVGNDRGLSCVFRQWRATHSHCSQLHGYSLGFKFTFGAYELDKNQWVLDFGKSGFGNIKDFLEKTFDHTILIAEDDPLKDQIIELATLTTTNSEKTTSLGDVRIVPAIGCEKTAEYVFKEAQQIIDAQTNGRVWVESVECFEHGANSGIYKKD